VNLSGNICAGFFDDFKNDGSFERHLGLSGSDAPLSKQNIVGVFRSYATAPYVEAFDKVNLTMPDVNFFAYFAPLNRSFGRGGYN
jgi:hypothetical protein